MSHANGVCIHLESLETRQHFTAIDGFTATYFSQNTFSGHYVTRIDDSIAFNWKKSAPAAGISAATFSARWTGNLNPTVTGTHTIYLSTEGGVRVWVNHKIVLNRWAAPGVVTNYKVNVTLEAGTSAPILIEYHHDAGKGAIGVAWVEPGRVKTVLGGSIVTAHTPTLDDQIDDTLMFAVDRLGVTYRTNMPANGFPIRSTTTDLAWLLQPASDWTSGTFAGSMWAINTAFPGAGWNKLATTWTTPLAGVKIVGDAFDREWAAYKPLYDATGDATAKKILLASAALKLSSYNKTVRAFLTPGIVSTSGNPKADFGVLMDQTMDMEMLLWAGQQTGNATYRDHVLAHMNTVAKTMVRANGSVVQRGYFDASTGQYIVGENYQGYSSTSTWSRAQGWAMDSFATVAADTDDTGMLAVAKKVANYYLANMPADGVPYWDFNAPGIPKTYRDTSAAAIAAGAMIKLAGITSGSDKATYLAGAEKILRSLTSSTYLAEGAAVKGVLQHGAYNVPADKGDDASLMFGDYYLLQDINAYISFAG